MRVYTATVAKDWSQANAPALNVARELRERTRGKLPWDDEFTTRTDEWVSPVVPIRIDVATNEPDSTGPLLQRHPDVNTVGWTGYLDESSLFGAG